MCIDPVSMMLIGGAVSAAGTLYTGAAQSASYRGQAAYADRQAVMAGQRGQYEATRQARQNDRQLASMRGQYLSTGIALEGSPLDVLQESATEASLDEQAIRYGSQVESDNYRFQASLARSNASSAMTGGVLGAISTGINTFTSLSEQRQNRTMIQNPYARYSAPGLY